MIASSEALSRKGEKVPSIEMTVWESFCQMCMPDPGPNLLLASDVRDEEPRAVELDTED